MIVDTGTLGVELGIVGIILAVPLGVAGGLLTPSFRSWWDSRTQASLRKRITFLEQELKRVEEEWCFSESEALLYEHVVRLHLLIGAFCLFILSLIIFSLVYFRRQLISIDEFVYYSLTAAVLVWWIGSIVVYFVNFHRVGSQRRTRTRLARIRIRAELNELVEKLGP